MRPIFQAQLVSRSFGDPGVYLDLMFERRAILLDIGDITALSTRKLPFHFSPRYFGREETLRREFAQA